MNPMACSEGYREVMPLLWERLNEKGRNWRIVFKVGEERRSALQVLMVLADFGIVGRLDENWIRACHRGSAGPAVPSAHPARFPTH